MSEVNSPEVITEKIISMIVMCVGSMIAGMAPALRALCQAKSTPSAANLAGNNNLIVTHSHAPPPGRWTSFLLCFGGGVLFHTTLFHMMPEVRESAEKVELKPLYHIRLPELLFSIGFALVLLIEEIVHAFLAHGNKACSEDPVHRTMSLHCQEPEHIRCSLEDIVTATNESPVQANNVPPSQPKNKQDHPHHPPSALKNVITIVALSMHEVLEGMAIGLATTSELVMNMAIAIALHKFVIAFCVGVQLKSAHMSMLKIAFSIGIFSFVTPVGGTLGMLLAWQGGGESQVTAVLNGLAAGTLLYVTFYEIIARELFNSSNKIFKLIGLVVGFLVMLGISTLIHHNHDGHHHHHHH